MASTKDERRVPFHQMSGGDAEAYFGIQWSFSFCELIVAPAIANSSLLLTHICLSNQNRSDGHIRIICKLNHTHQPSFMRRTTFGGSGTSAHHQWLNSRNKLNCWKRFTCTVCKFERPTMDNIHSMLLFSSSSYSSPKEIHWKCTREFHNGNFLPFILTKKW